MIDEDREAAAAAYALGALPPEEASAFESLLEKDAELQQLVREFGEVSARLAEGAGSAAPSPGLRERVIASVRTDAGTGTPVIPLRPRGRWSAMAWAAAAAGLVLAGVQTARLSRAGDRIEHLAASYDSVTRHGIILEERQTAILDGNSRMYELKPTAAGEAVARFGAQIFWRRDVGTWLVHVFDMPRLPAGQVYQLWYVTAEAKISAGVFEVDAEGHGVAVLKVPPPAAAAVVAAMSVEPGPAGSPQPTGPIVMAGRVSD